MIDCEYFFDGFKVNLDYVLDCVCIVYYVGVCWVVLCDINGGILLEEVCDIVMKVQEVVFGFYLGIYIYDDIGYVVVNLFVVVEVGVCQIQGMFNGLGECCGNVNLIILILILKLKL